MARRKLEDILDAHQSEVEAECGEQITGEVLHSFANLGDPAKADTCGNCGALAWSDPVLVTDDDESSYLVRLCNKCNYPTWVSIYPTTEGKGAHTEGEER